MTCVVIPPDSHPYVCNSPVGADMISDLIRAIPGGFIPEDVPVVVFAPENQEDAENRSNMLASVFLSVATGGCHHLAGTVVITGNGMSPLGQLLGGSVFTAGNGMGVLGLSLAQIGAAFPEPLSEEVSAAMVETLTAIRLALHGEPTPGGDHMDPEEFQTRVQKIADHLLGDPRVELRPIVAGQIDDLLNTSNLN
jgi:hypothetical protein